MHARSGACTSACSRFSLSVRELRYAAADAALREDMADPADGVRRSTTAAAVAADVVGIWG